MSAMIRPTNAALTTVRGFEATPVTSGDEDSDYGAPLGPAQRSPLAKRNRKKRAPIIDDIVSANCSPILRPAPSPAMSGIAKLRMQMEPLSLNTDSAVASRASSMTRSNSRQFFDSPRMPSLTYTERTNTIASSDTSRGRTGSSNASGDEAASDTTTSYEINLETDFVSETVREDSCLEAAAAQSADSLFPGENETGASPARKMTTADFEQLRCLGKGTYGTVLLVKQHSTGRLYAQKQFKKASLVVHKKLVEQTKTERQILESVNRHPFVVKLFYAFQDQEKLYLILEYGLGGELFTHLNTEKMFSEATAAFYMGEMMLALSHLHDTLGVVYRDLKPENCLLDAEGHLLLTDFGLSKVAVDSPDSCNSILGTVEYMAPEIILGQKYGKAVDWWSFGALGFDLMTGNPPFRGGNHAKIQENIVKQKLTFPYFLSKDATDLLGRLLRKDPKKRLGACMPKDLQTLQKHRFFRKIDWKKLAARELDPPIQPMITDPELAENFAPEFTELSLSPVQATKEVPGAWAVPERAAAVVGSCKEDNPFGGFSFVASNSLLEGDGFRFSDNFA